RQKLVLRGRAQQCGRQDAPDGPFTAEHVEPDHAGDAGGKGNRQADGEQNQKRDEKDGGDHSAPLGCSSVKGSRSVAPPAAVTTSARQSMMRRSPSKPAPTATSR